VSEAEVDELEDRLRTINGMAQLQRAQRADVSVDYVLGVGGFDLERVEEEVGPDVE
jgi:G3E family GTPase